MSRDPSIEVRRIPIPTEIADGMATRLAALSGAVKCIAVALEGGEEVGDEAANALRGVQIELERIYVDLDICAWDKYETVNGSPPPKAVLS